MSFNTLADIDWGLRFSNLTDEDDAEKLALETTCLRLSRDLAAARSRISELENEVAAFKRNNRYQRGHTAGYEEARKKYQNQ